MKFLALYMASASTLDEWKKVDQATRDDAEKKMQAEWQAWMTKNAGKVSDTAGVGATKRITSAGASDTRNEIMLYSIVEAASHDEAAALFGGHPHLGIPGAWIDVMPMNPLHGMQGMEGAAQ